MKRDEYEIMFRVEDRHWWYAGLRSMLDAHWRRYVFDERPRILDIGCGTGATLHALRPLALGMGIDYSFDAVRFCRARDARCTAVASAGALPFPPGAFDVAVSFDVLCHRSIRDKQIPLREIHRVLKPGGLLMLNLPAYQWLLSSHDTHVFTDRRFTRPEIVRLLDECSFQPLRTTYWNTILFPPIAAVRMWRKLLPKASSDLDNAATTCLSPLLGGFLTVERALIRRFSLPFGLSVFAVARKR